MTATKPKPKREAPKSFRADRSLRNEIRAAAEAVGKSDSQWIRQAIEAALPRKNGAAR